MLSIDGQMTAAKRDAVVRTWKAGGPNVPRVLIISSIGAVGLNLADANIIVIMVSAHIIA